MSLYQVKSFGKVVEMTRDHGSADRCYTALSACDKEMWVCDDHGIWKRTRLCIAGHEYQPLPKEPQRAAA